MVENDKPLEASGLSGYDCSVPGICQVPFGARTRVTLTEDFKDSSQSIQANS
jgi:hypothetical protein